MTNGDFSSVTYGGSKTGVNAPYFGDFGRGGSLTVTGWSSTGYNFVFAPGTVDEGGTGGALGGQPNEAPGQYNTSSGYGNTYLWGSHNGGASTYPATDPAGGNFLAADGAFETGAIVQVVNNLTVGKLYQLNFYWAAGQQASPSFTGTTSEAWSVSLGGSTQFTSTYNLASKSFSGWMSDSMLFTATATSETLSFLAVGSPNGQPPFSLLGGVDLQAIPDYSNWAVFAAFGVACVAVEGIRRRQRRAEA